MHATYSAATRSPSPPPSITLARLAEGQAVAAAQLAGIIDGGGYNALPPNARAELRSLACIISEWSDLTRSVSGETTDRAAQPPTATDLRARVIAALPDLAAIVRNRLLGPGAR